MNFNNFYDAILQPLEMLLTMFFDLMQTPVEGFGDLTVFNICFVSFIVYTVFRFIIDPLFGVSFKWHLKSDTVAESNKVQKTDYEKYIERESLNYWRR